MISDSIELDGRVTRLFENPACWTQGTYAKDANGRSVNLDEPAATCFCLVGAVMRCYPDRYSGFIVGIERQLTNQESLIVFNDNSTYDEVVSFCRRINL